MASRDDFEIESEWMKQKQSKPPEEKERVEEPKAPEVKDDVQIESDWISKEKISKSREKEQSKAELQPEPKAVAAPELKAEEPRIYVVQKGDSLSKISRKVYGNAGRWREIYEANKDRIKDPSLIRPGWKLRIP